MDRIACFLPKKTHHVIFADEKFLCQTFNRNVLGQVCIYIVQDIQNTAVGRYDGLCKGGIGVLHSACKRNQKAQKKTVA